MDLTARASNGLIDPVIGRDTQIQRIVQILCRRTKSNPILLGEAGVGKTAIAEGLALSIADGNVPVFLMVSILFIKEIIFLWCILILSFLINYSLKLFLLPRKSAYFPWT